MNKILKNLSILTKPQSIIGIVISLLGIWWAFKDFEFNEFVNNIKDVHYEYILLACILIIFSVILRAIRWKLLFRKSDNVEVYPLFKYELIGYFGNNVLPLRLGEVLRAYILGQRYKLSKSYVLGTIIVERLLDTLSLMALSILLLFIYPMEDSLKELVYYGLGFGLVIIVLLIAMNKLNLFKSENRIVKLISNFIDGFKNIEPSKIPQLFLLGCATWMIYWFDVHLIQYAFDFGMSPAQSLLVLVVTSLFMSIPSAPGMIGTFHAGVKLVMVDIFMFSIADADAFAIVVHAYGFIAYTLLGAIYFMRSQFHENAISKIIGENE